MGRCHKWWRRWHTAEGFTRLPINTSITLRIISNFWQQINSLGINYKEQVRKTWTQLKEYHTLINRVCVLQGRQTMTQKPRSGNRSFSNDLSRKQPLLWLYSFYFYGSERKKKKHCWTGLSIISLQRLLWTLIQHLIILGTFILMSQLLYRDNTAETWRHESQDANASWKQMKSAKVTWTHMNVKSWTSEESSLAFRGLNSSVVGARWLV